MEQRTAEWLGVRLGKVTASRVHDVIAQTKAGYSTSRKNYTMELMVERLTNTKQESYTNCYMQPGIDNEPIARAAYEQVICGLVHEAGFVEHSLIKYFGCSPDGLVERKGLVEIKCPNIAQHVDTILYGFPSRYRAAAGCRVSAPTTRAECGVSSGAAELGDGAVAAACGWARAGSVAPRGGAGGHSSNRRRSTRVAGSGCRLGP